MYRISVKSDNPVVNLAMEELIRYGKGAFTPADNVEQADILLYSKDSSRLQDSFSLKSIDDKLFITGSNPRSVLYGVYEYLKYSGFAFLYPGPEGEIIPESPQFTVDGFDRKETASRTFRGIAARPEPGKLEEGIQLIHFMAKNKYNLFFMEGYDEDRPGDQYSVIDGVHPLQHVDTIRYVQHRSPGGTAKHRTGTEKDG